MGRFGPFVQIGTRTMRRAEICRTATRTEMDSIILAEAMDLFQLPRTLDNGERRNDRRQCGPLRPVRKYGSKYGLTERRRPLHHHSRARARSYPPQQGGGRESHHSRFSDDGIQVLNGRYGPYITDKKKNARIPKGREPKTLTLEECQA